MERKIGQVGICLDQRFLGHYAGAKRVCNIKLFDEHGVVIENSELVKTLLDKEYEGSDLELRMRKDVAYALGVDVEIVDIDDN